jgi:hypothetical protein
MFGGMNGITSALAGEISDKQIHGYVHSSGIFVAAGKEIAWAEHAERIRIQGHIGAGPRPQTVRKIRKGLPGSDILPPRTRLEQETCAKEQN